MSTKDKSLLLRLLNTPGITSIPVLSVVAGELTLEAQGPNVLDLVRYIFESGVSRNLLEIAPVEWWQTSESLEQAVIAGFIRVLDPNAEVAQVASPIVVAEEDFITVPPNSALGDLIVYNGSTFVTFPPGPLGFVVTSAGPGAAPSYQPVGGGALDPDKSVIDGQTTAGLISGEFGYISGNNTWGKAISDGTLTQATCAGAWLGTPGTILISGRDTIAKFTLAGGAPAPGAEVYIAAATDDGGAGAGKLTATAPSTGFLTVAGICLDNTNYGASQTCVVLFNPGSPQVL